MKKGFAQNMTLCMCLNQAKKIICRALRIYSILSPIIHLTSHKISNLFDIFDKSSESSSGSKTIIWSD
jgi:hypothetical protein